MLLPELVRDSGLVLGTLDGSYRHPEPYSRWFRRRAYDELVGIRLLRRRYRQRILPRAALLIPLAIAGAAFSVVTGRLGGGPGRGLA